MHHHERALGRDAPEIGKVLVDEMKLHIGLGAGNQPALRDDARKRRGIGGHGHGHDPVSSCEVPGEPVAVAADPAGGGFGKVGREHESAGLSGMSHRPSA